MWVPFNHPMFFLWAFENLDQGSMLSLPDVDIVIVKGCCSDILSIGAKCDMIPAQLIDYVLELMLNLDVNCVEIEAFLGEIR
jgi:hypothetical protein